MSRTDAHVPYWVWADWYEPDHHLYCPNRINRLWQKRNGRTEPCNLPEHPVRHAGVRTRMYVGLCTWEPVRPSWRQARWLHLSPTPKWFIDHHWNNPERVRTRDVLGKFVKEYNATGEIDDADFPCYQGRHGARWAWD